MKLRALGEDALVAKLVRGLPLGPQVRAGAGDDCAVIGGARDKIWRLLKTDAVVEGVHFELGENLARVGWKALCRNLSDIAAMGGEPREALLTVALSPETELTAVQQLYRGLRKAATRFGVSLVGGETCRSPGPLFLSVALTGEVERRRCVFRSGGKPGDLLFVTGTLGGSRAGKHLDFTPRLAEARWLTENARPTAMMDLSDGLGSDLPRLATASCCHYELQHGQLPLTAGATPRQALSDGEDFELLFAQSPRQAARMLARWPKGFPRLTQIGTLEPRKRRLPKGLAGYDHFATSVQ